MSKYIFVIGGVMSGVGKGVTTASIGKILQSRGYRVTAIKIDPYVNVDAGTMNPIEHGEVFVTDDGLETDQDIGNYERFLGVDLSAENYMTTGSIYLAVIQRERNLEYGGKCVQVVPHIPEEVIRRIKNACKKQNADIAIIEIGGTVGEYENILFLEAARMMHLKSPDDILFVLVSYMPIPSHIGEMKTKPTQHATRTLNSAGIHPDFIICRGEKYLDKPRREKLSIFCNVGPDDIISAPDLENIYEVPLFLEKVSLSEKILEKLKLKKKKQDLKEWRKMVRKIKSAKQKVCIGIVGKYFGTGDFTLADSYISVIEAVKHAAWHNNVEPKLVWVNSEAIEQGDLSVLENMHGIIIPQGWGSRGSEGKIRAIQYAREKKIPYLGLCYGMQMAVIEFARNVCGLKKANSLEVDPSTPDPVIYIMPEQERYLKENKYGGTIRLGAWPCVVRRNTQSFKSYQIDKISERHRHRYEFNQKYRKQMEDKGLTIAGTSPDGKLVEIIEIKDHPFFVGTQFHPEYKSRPNNPHPLFLDFIKAAKKLK